MNDLHYYTKSKRFKQEFITDEEGPAAKVLVEWVLKMQHLVMVELGIAEKDEHNEHKLKTFIFDDMKLVLAKH